MQPRPGTAPLPGRMAALGSIAMLVGACGSATGSATNTPTSTPPPATHLATVEPSVAAATGQSIGLPANGLIVFYRTDDARLTNTPFSIEPDGSHETEMHDGGLEPGVWSPDGTRLAVHTLVKDPSPTPGAEPAWQRPAVINADGSGFRLLNAYPDRKMHLDPLGWTGDGSRIFVYSGGEDVTASDMGLYTIRASDGGDLKKVFTTPAGTNDSVLLSPGRSKILVTRSSSDFDRALYVADVDGSNFVRLTSPDLNVVNLEFYDGISADWSPDGSKIAFGAQLTGDGDPPALYVVNADGADLRSIVPANTGAVSVQWSPAGDRIAFTSKLRTSPQVWVIGSDGLAMHPLTDGADGSESIVPLWSPDARQLLFQRALSRHVTLWSMAADGSNQKQVSTTPLAVEWVGGYGWWPAPRR
jgi:Tol biopolymer transport system component